MRRLPGQAGRLLAGLLHRCLHFTLALAILAASGITFLSWRLSEGPLELTWLARRLEAVANAGESTKLSIGSAAVAWNGFRHGLDQPLVIQLANLTATEQNGSRVAALPHAVLSLSPGWLLLGRIVPRTLEVDGARLHVTREADGATRLDLGTLTKPAAPAPAQPTAPDTSLADITAELMQPAQSDSGFATSRLSQLRQIHIRDAQVDVIDHQFGADWQARSITIDLNRQPGGGVRGTGDITVALSDQQVGINLDATLDPATHGTALQVHVTPVTPARFATLAPGLDALAALDAPLTLALQASLGPDLRPRTWKLHADLGAGTVHVGRGTTMLADAALDAQGTLDQLQFDIVRLALVPRQDGPQTVIKGHADVKRAAGRLGIAATLDLDQANFADLAALWPEGTGGPGTRPWMTKNITAGIGRNGHVEVALQMPEDFSDVTLTSISGGLDGRDITLWWLRPVPPIEHIDGHLTITAPDVLDITMANGHQTGGTQGGLVARTGKVHLTGIAGNDQFADIDADITGPLPDLLTLLKNPKIRLLDRRPVPMTDPAGQIAGHLSVTHLPLRDKVSLDDIQIHTVDKLTQVHLGGIAAGRDIDHGMLDLDAGNDGLHVRGSADIAKIPSQLAVDMDFRLGPPTQILQTIIVSGVANEHQLIGAGLPVGHLFTGTLGFMGEMETRRSGRGDVTVHLDLEKAGLKTARLNMDKPEGQLASGDAHIVLDHDRLAAIDHVLFQGKGIDVRGDADVAGGHPNVLRLERVVLGRTNIHGVIRLPAQDGDSYGVTLAGPSLDASGLLSKSTEIATPDQPAAANPAPGPPWSVDARVDRVILGSNRTVSGLSVRAENDGTLLQRAQVEGRTASASPFHFAIEPHPGGRTLTGSVADMGGLLRAFDVLDEMVGGRFDVSGSYDDRTAAHPLTANATLSDFKVRGVAALGKILQAMTLYGVVDALTGPGLYFTKLDAPFSYEGDTLHLGAARAFSSSLGMTATGDVDLKRRVAEIRGTIVPAYFLNSLLGDVPLVGRLFSPERGGGVFSATYSVRGPLDDPAVSVNPLAALTPGFLRGIFGIFDAQK